MTLRASLLALTLFALPATAFAQTAAPGAATATVKKVRMHKPQITASMASTAPAPTSAAAANAPATAASPKAPRVRKPKAVPMATVAPAPAAVTVPIVAPVPVAVAPRAAPAAVAPAAAGAKPRSAAQMAAGNRMKACGAEWQGMRSAGTTGGKTWRQFSSECLRKR